MDQKPNATNAKPSGLVQDTSTSKDVDGCQSILTFQRVLEIDELPKTVNAMGKGSIWASHAERHRWRRIIAIHSKLIQPPRPLLKASLKLTRCSSNEPDLDNLYASFKYVIDALVMHGVLIDDKPSKVSLNCAWEKAPRLNGKIRIELEGYYDPAWIKPPPKQPRSKKTLKKKAAF